MGPAEIHCSRLHACKVEGAETDALSPDHCGGKSQKGCVRA
jgi:hypothetical protein